MIMTTLTIGIYSFIMYSRFQNGLYSTMTLLRFWSIFFLLLMLISIVLSVLSEILLGIMLGIKKELSKDPDTLTDIIDERDKLIELKTTKFAQYVFVLGFISGLVALYFDASIHYFFIFVLVFGFLSEVTEHGLNIYYREKGIR